MRTSYLRRCRRQVVCLLALLLLALPRAAAQSEAPPTPRPCLVILGDSLAYGAQVVQLPGINFAELQTTPFSHVLHDALQARGYLHIGIYDASARATALAAPDLPSYPASERYTYVRGLNCAYVLIFPWLNDLAATAASGDPAPYRDALTALLDDVRAASPASHIVLLGYYNAPLEEAGRQTYGTAITAQHVQQLNDLHQAQCAAHESLLCYDVQPALQPIEAHVVRAITRAEFEARGYTGMTEGARADIQRYFQLYPGQAIRGDGLHLNQQGKQALAAALIDWLVTLDADGRPFRLPVDLPAARPGEPG